MRFNFVGVIMGGRGTGKTLYVIGSEYSSKPGDEKLNIESFIKISLDQGKKVLVLDTMDHPSYRNIQILSQSNFKNWKSGVVRIIARNSDMSKLVNLINVTPSLNNTFIIMEDAAKYTDKELPKPFETLNIESKQRNIDVFYMYHSWGDTPNDIFRKGIDFIYLLKTEDSPVIRKNNLRLFDKVLAAYNRIIKNKSRFYGEFIDTSMN